MKISFSATNPCHMYACARAVALQGHGGVYYSGYPEWKLGNTTPLHTKTHSFRTNVVYGLLRYFPEPFRPTARKLFLWQDHGFDRWVGRHLEAADFIHAMPGQCLHTFASARRLGVRTVMNHATGPVRHWVRIMEPEYERAGLKMTEFCAYDTAYFEREDDEYSKADFHCAASAVVRQQLIQTGIPEDRIWLVPYGADPAIFHPPAERQPQESGFSIVFSGQVGLRKGLKSLLDALELSERSDWNVHFYGAKLRESDGDLRSYRGAPKLHFHGAVSQRSLADAFRRGSVLVLPSLEEGFGLVVPQALNCGMPCIVSDRVGAKDLIRHRDNGSIVPVQDPNALATELKWWEANPKRLTETFDWTEPAQQLIRQSAAALN